MGSQIERLRRDQRELKHYMKRLEKEGNTPLIHKLKQKYEYLDSKLSDIEEELLA
jgi:Mg-chelatase subunit ChlD